MSQKILSNKLFNRGNKEMKTLEGGLKINLYVEKMQYKVEIELNITQHVSKSNVDNFDEFVDVFEDADPYFIEDSFDHLGISSVSSNFKVGKCEDQKDTYSRTINGKITFSVNSIDELKEFLEEEYVLDDSDFDSNRFVRYYIGDIDAVNVSEDEDGDFISIEIDESDVDGEIKFNGKRPTVCVDWF